MPGLAAVLSELPPDLGAAAAAAAEPAAAVAAAAAVGPSGGRSSSRLIAGAAHAPSSFIRRCWFEDRGCQESSKCSDMRELFKVAEHVKKLPHKCDHPTYVVSGTRYAHGFMERNHLETLTHPAEEWHKCCLTGGDKHGEHQHLACEKLQQYSHTDLVNNHNGYCGPHYCMGDQHRCFVVDKVVNKDFKSLRPGFCPPGCPNSCVHITHKFECIDLGKEPPSGKEGDESVVNRRDPDPEHYQVFSLSMPAALAALPDCVGGSGGCGGGGAAASARTRCGAVAGRCRRSSWSRFLG